MSLSDKPCELFTFALFLIVLVSITVLRNICDTFTRIAIEIGQLCNFPIVSELTLNAQGPT